MRSELQKIPDRNYKTPQGWFFHILELNFFLIWHILNTQRALNEHKNTYKCLKKNILQTLHIKDTVGEQHWRDKSICRPKNTFSGAKTNFSPMNLRNNVFICHDWLPYFFLSWMVSYNSNQTLNPLCQEMFQKSCQWRYTAVAAQVAVVELGEKYLYSLVSTFIRLDYIIIEV